MKIEYTKNLVAFIDVLGFKNIVYSQKTDDIQEYYTFLLSRFQEAVTKHNFDYLLISDSIVIYSHASLENLSRLLKIANILQAGLLAKGIPVRGAISQGNLFVDKANNIIVGPGLANAYQLEAQAKFPRIVIDRSVIESYYHSIDIALAKNTVSNLPHLSVTPHNGAAIDFPYLNYGRIIATSLTNKTYEGAHELIKKNYYRNDNIEKYEWLKCHLIYSLQEQKRSLEMLPSPNQNERKRLRLVAKHLINFLNI
ncbi:hypothetical protein [Stutzerimonas nitrititolerans]|uniref:hypothetical protein n=1 Tax=Stutzerimonas nitrititolerans TaxID=2482751 RepID=UPI0028A06B4D|nr:hypothetical protein [Stutzerimonas nitrititolerans]